MHRTGEDTAEDYPQIGRRTELSTHYRTENRTCSGDIQELNHENFPVWQHDEIHSIGLRHCGSNAVIGRNNALYETSVK